MRFRYIGAIASTIALAGACEGEHSCYGPQDGVVQNRNVRRMQPDAQTATIGPKGPLEWGQINFLHTTDTHGWLEGHLKEQNYGADWGDFVSFTKHMKEKARNMGVDLLLVDTGDLHDGAGLSDATSPNGLISNSVFQNIDYDLLAIGNHELYVTEVAYETFNNFSKVYGDRYLTSNVQILNPATNELEYIGQKYRYFTTETGIRIMAFGVLFDFTGNSNVSKVTKAADLVQENWFKEAVNYPEPIDLFVLIGHNPVRFSDPACSFDTVFSAIRRDRPDVPIQGFGGHTHIRDFAVWDNKATALESGRYCETLGWLAMSGLERTYKMKENPEGVPNPTQSAVAIRTGTTTNTVVSYPTSTTPSSLRYSRRYLDWNRLTFANHALGSQNASLFNTPKGLDVTDFITDARNSLKITSLYGCAPQTWCISCAPFLSPGNIYTLLQHALSTIVTNPSRISSPRLIIINTGSVRFDIPQGLFTADDAYMVSPFKDNFQYLPDVPYAAASKILPALNAGRSQKRHIPSSGEREECTNPSFPSNHGQKRHRSAPGPKRRQVPSPGYVTTDDFGADGDDTPHAPVKYYPQPNNLQANASFPQDGTEPETVDVVFLDFIAKRIVDVLNREVKGEDRWDVGMVKDYVDKGGEIVKNGYLAEYVKKNWRENVEDCPVGGGVGS